MTMTVQDTYDSTHQFSHRKPVCVVDASSAIILFKAGIFDYVIDMYSLVISDSVFKEITRNKSYPGADYFLQLFTSGRFQVLETILLESRLTAEFHPSLGQGETDTIRLYLNGRGDFIMIDDGPGASWCKKNKIPYINALLLPRILFFSSLVNADEYNRMMKKIISIGRYSEAVISFALKASRDDLSFFIHNNE